MNAITVTPAGKNAYSVDVEAGASATHHVVTADDDARERLAAGVSGETLVEAAFRFLLDREPKESIMARFDILDIARFFPEFPDRIGDYL